MQNRREFLTIAAASTVVLAGCSGSDDGDDDSDDDASDDGDDGDGESNGDDTGGNGDDGEPEDGEFEEWRDFDRPDDWPADPTFIPNPDVEDPGGEIPMAVEVSMREVHDPPEFESFTLDVQEVVLHEEGGDSVTVPVDRTVDFYDYDLETALIVAFDAGIPAGRYLTVDVHLEAEEIVHAEEGDVTGDFGSNTLSADFGSSLNEPGVEVDEQFVANVTFRPDDPPYDMLAISGTVGYFSSGFGDMTDPEWFVDDD